MKQTLWWVSQAAVADFQHTNKSAELNARSKVLVRKPFGSLYLPKLFLFAVPIQLAPVIIMSPREVT